VEAGGDVSRGARAGGQERDLIWFIVYLVVGALWGTGVTVARLLIDVEPYPRMYVWLPATVLLWPWSVGISVVNFYWGIRGREWVCDVCGVTDWENHKSGCTNDPERGRS
jgi:hypothetical protein